MTGTRELAGRLALAVGGAAVGLLLLAVLEGALRVLDVGAERGFFTEERTADGTRVLRLSWNPQFEKPQEPQPWRQFLADKPAGGFRIFVVGESSAEGVPYGTPYAFARWLADRLAAEVPEVRWEVVNAALAGAQSGAMLAMARDIARHQPDLLVVYLGHNEIGARMTAAERAQIDPERRDWRASLAQLRLYRLAARLLPRAGKRLDFRDAERSGARTGSRENYASDADRVVLTRLYRERVTTMVRTMRAAGAHTALLSLSQNFADWPPVVSVHRRELAPAEKAAWRAAVKQGEALAPTDCASALAAWQKALALDDGYAQLQYEAAGCERRLGRLDEARARLRRASEVDRFSQGAPLAFNDVLREVAQDEGALFVDVDAAFVRASGDRLVGDDLFVDPLHPNIRGHQVIAATVAEALRQAGVPVPAARWRTGVYVPPDPEALTTADPELRVKSMLTRALACYVAGRTACAMEQIEAAKRATTDETLRSTLERGQQTAPAAAR